MQIRENLTCFELLDPCDSLLPEVQQLYERTQAPEERIPWEWLGRSVERRSQWRPGRWCPHLLVTVPRRDGDLGPVTGFAYGGHIPGFGGYICYLGVDPEARKQGAGTRLFEQTFRILAVDAAAEGQPLPFAVWESHRPEADAPASAWDLWTARVRLFDRVGGLWVEGVDFLSPNFRDEDGPPVALQLFVKPMDLPASAFDAERLRRVVGGLHERVYRNQPGEALYDGTLPPGCLPRLAPARLAAVREERGVLV